MTARAGKPIQISPDNRFAAGCQKIPLRRDRTAGEVPIKRDIAVGDAADGHGTLAVRERKTLHQPVIRINQPVRVDVEIFVHVYGFVVGQAADLQRERPGIGIADAGGCNRERSRLGETSPAEQASSQPTPCHGSRKTINLFHISTIPHVSSANNQ